MQDPKVYFRYFALQYQGCQDETERAMSSEAYQGFLDNRQPSSSTLVDTQ